MSSGLMARYQKSRRSSLTLYRRPVTSNDRIRGILHAVSLDPLPPADPGPPPKSDLRLHVPCDDGVPQTIQLVKRKERQSSSTKLEPLPPLSRTVDAEFLALLEKKVSLCCFQCDFSDSDIDQQNRAVKQSALQEILAIYSEHKLAVQLPMEVNVTVLSMCESNIFRQLPVADPIVLLTDQIPVFQDQEMQHISLCYKILQKLIVLTEKNSIVTMDFARKLMKCFNSPDLDEREMLANVMYMLYQLHTSHSSEFISRIGVLLTEYREGIIPPFCVIPCLVFLSRLLQAMTQSLPPVFFEVCTQSVLQLLATRHVVLFFPIFSKFVVMLASFNESMAMRTVQMVVLHWPSTCPSKQECFINLMTDVIPYLTRDDFMKHVRMIFTMYQNCASSTAKVVDASLRLWRENELRPHILEKTKVIFPMLFYAYLDISKNHWSAAIQTKVLSVLKTMQCLDSVVYQDLMARANDIVPRPEDSKAQRNWAIIARTAARVDRNVDVSQTLGEIQMQFNSYLQESIGSRRTIKSGNALVNARVVVPSPNHPTWS